MSICSEEKCQGRVVARELCDKHYRRLRRRGTTEEPPPRVRPTCSVVGCDRAHEALGLCQVHYMRVRRHGAINDRPRDPRRSNRWSGEAVGYSGAHRRVVRAKGRATDHACSHCSGVAAHWAYDHGDADERVDSEGRLYSVDSTHYFPLCARCHVEFDGNTPQAMKAAPARVLRTTPPPRERAPA